MCGVGLGCLVCVGVLCRDHKTGCVGLGRRFGLCLGLLLSCNQLVIVRSAILNVILNDSGIRTGDECAAGAAIVQCGQIGIGEDTCLRLGGSGLCLTCRRGACFGRLLCRGLVLCRVIDNLLGVIGVGNAGSLRQILLNLGLCFKLGLRFCCSLLVSLLCKLFRVVCQLLDVFLAERDVVVVGCVLIDNVVDNVRDRLIIDRIVRDDRVVCILRLVHCSVDDLQLDIVDNLLRDLLVLGGVAQILGDLNLLCREILRLLADLASGRILISHQDPGQRAGAGYLKWCCRDGLAVCDAAGNQVGCNHVAGDVIQVGSLDLDPSGRCRLYQRAADGPGADLLDRNIGCQVAALILVRDGDGLNAVVAVDPEIPEDRTLLILCQIGADGDDHGSVGKNGKRSSSAKKRCRDGCRCQYTHYFLFHRISSSCLKAAVLFTRTFCESD